MDIKKHFSSIKDPRIERGKLHSLDTIFTLTITASLCGVKSWEHISAFGRERQAELSEIIDFANGVPSHDTLERVFSVINPKEFLTCFVAWAQSLNKVNKKLIAIDGKVAKSSYDELKNLEPLYLVNVWASENKLVLGQVKTKGKGHEIAGVKEILNILEIEGAIISTDALSCQKDITEIITQKKGDYILAVKDNQEFLKQSIVSSFAILKPISEDKSRKRKGYSAENYALINKIAINILNNDRETKLSMVMKKLKAMCNIGYVKELLNFDA